MARVKVNYLSVKAKFNKALDEIEGDAKDKLKDVALDLSVRSPVDTGAYASSFSVVGSGSRSTRSVSSEGRPVNQDVGAYQELAFRTMESDIEGLDIKKSGRVQIKNGAPHAPLVEAEHQVFAVIKDRYRGI